MKSCLFCGSEISVISTTPNRGDGIRVKDAVWLECEPCDTGFLYLNSGKLLQINFYHKVQTSRCGFNCYIVSQHQDSGVTEFKKFNIWGDDSVILSQDTLPPLTPQTAIAKLKFILLFS